jgi:alpha-1,6-mannosyltransferase
VAGAAVALLIIWRATARADRASALRGVGWALIVLALSGPVIYGWYMAWGLFAAAAGSRPQDRTVLVVLSAWVCTIGLPPMQGVPAVLRVITWAGVVLLWWWARPAPMRAPRLLEREGAGAV